MTAAVLSSPPSLSLLTIITFHERDDDKAAATVACLLAHLPSRVMKR